MARPPRRSEEPRTRRRLDKTEPTREHLTTDIFPLCNAKRAMMSSVAFPQVAFKSPPTVGPVKYVICSVRKLRRSAKGTSPIMLKTKSHAWNNRTAMANWHLDHRRRIEDVWVMMWYLEFHTLPKLKQLATMARGTKGNRRKSFVPKKIS